MDFDKIFTILFFILGFHNVRYVNGGDTCTRRENGYTVEEYCDYGCCGSGNDQSCCSISTSVLLVACIVGGLVLLALVAAIVVCCYKNYKDKQTTRVRNLQQQQQDMNAPRVPGVEPPKPPSYISAPPAYSEEMPESHFRPATVTGNVPYNQRFRGSNLTVRENAQGMISMTTSSRRHPATSSIRNVQIPGSVEVEAPPPYTEFARGRTPAHRRRRFIRTPVDELTEQTSQNNVVISTVQENTDRMSQISDNSREQETSMQMSTIQPSGSATSRAIDSRATESRAIESRVETIRENESRAETVARILRPSRISRIPTRVHGIQSRQLSDVQSRGSFISPQDTLYSENSPNPNEVGRMDQSRARHNIDLSDI